MKTVSVFAPNIFFLVYARKSSRHNWDVQTRKDDAVQAVDFAGNLLQTIEKDSRFVGCHWQVKIVTANKSEVIDVPVNLPANVNWYQAGLIPFASMEQNPDQSIYNGGN